MADPIEIHAYHGWGFDADFWDPLKAVIPEQISFKAASRGYFGTPQFPRFESTTKKRVVMTHSFGLHWCTTAVLSKADFLVIFNGFGDFLPPEPKSRKRVLQKLELTIQMFQQSPREVLPTFKENAFNPAEPINSGIPETINTERALADLKSMKDLQFPIIDLDFGAVMIALDGDQDQVLGEPRGEEILSDYVGKKHHEVFAGAGHCLPATHPEDCWSYLCSVIPIFQGL